ncbi:ZP domain-containing protein, partial [Trichonephila inaurata madagascariensis]
WNAAMLKDVVISRISGNRISSNARTSQYPANNHDNVNTIDVGENAIYRDQRTEDTTAHDVAQIVFGDGCRNPQYRPIAPFHPQRDPNNPLSVNFVFKAFMFQNMLDGESLRLSAQVVACAELSDCQQAFCNGEIPRGKRKRREFRNISGTAFEQPSVKNFTEDFQLTVTLGGFSQTPFVSESPSVTKKQSFLITDCKLILISVSSAAVLFCLATTSAAAIAIGSKRKGILSPRQEEELKLKKKLERLRMKK